MISAQFALNAVALAGWVGVLASVVAEWHTFRAASGSRLLRATQSLETICVFEVVLILVGAARGRAALGVCVHAARLVVAFWVIPAGPTLPSTRLVLLAWSITETCRYPMFLTRSRSARMLRYAVPVLTFPLGVFAEAIACRAAMSLLSTPLAYLAGVVHVFNCVGFFFVYPQIVSKAQQATKCS